MLRILSIVGIFLFSLNPTWAEELYPEVGVVVLPSNDFQAEAQRMNQEIHRQVPKVKALKNNFHITLFHVRMPENQVDSFVSEVQTLVQETASFDLQLDPKLEPISNHYILWNIQPSQPLQLLHEKVLRIAQKYRNGPLSRAQDAYLNLDDLKRKEIDQFGVVDVLDHFQPHITLCYRIEATPSELKRILGSVHPRKGLTHFKATRIGIADLGYYGNAIKMNKTIELKKF